MSGGQRGGLGDTDRNERGPRRGEREIVTRGRGGIVRLGGNCKKGEATGVKQNDIVYMIRKSQTIVKIIKDV
jgi:hypothetical protein